MEVDERLRWLEARISSSLKPRGEELRSLFADEENRSAFLAFCNHSESRRLFVHLSGGRDLEVGGEGTIRVTSHPPAHLSDKSLVFLKCSHASKLSRESIAEDVVYSECSKLPLQHMELVMREVYLPLMGVHDQSHGVSADKLLDLIHRLLAVTQVTHGYTEGQVVLPLPSIDVLAEAAASSNRRATVIHILESSVVAWMKQVKMALHLDPSSAILRSHGKYAGPLAEVEFWTERLHRLESVRDQLSSVVVQNILHNLEQVHSTYAQAFIHVHRDVEKAIVDTELCLVYLSALKPWLLRLHEAFYPDTVIQTFPPLMTCLLLIWQHSGFYSGTSAFLRMLHLLSNEVMLKARDIVGADLLPRPEKSLVNLKLALRVCAGFRGCYLDYREKAENILRVDREEQSQPNSNPRGVLHCLWPPRNSPVFTSLNAFMERANDLLELVQTVHDFRELEVAAYGVGEEPPQSVVVLDPLLGDLYSEFTASVQMFDEDMLSLEADGQFEETFFKFRSTIRSLEKQLVGVLQRLFDLCPTLMVELRVLETFQGLLRREAMQTSLRERCEEIVSKLLSDIQALNHALNSCASNPPPIINIPPTASKLLWLHSLRQRVNGPMECLRTVAPYLLEGDHGWRLRQEHADLCRNIDSHAAETENSWVQSIPLGLSKRLTESVLSRTPEGHLEVNLDPGLRVLLREAHYLSRPPLNVRLPTAVRQLIKSVDVDDLRQRYVSLEEVAHTYSELVQGMSEVDRMLFQHKLQLVDSLLSLGLGPINWTSTDFPDFVAKSKAMIQGDLHSALSHLYSHTEAVRKLTASWSQFPGLDMFAERGEETLAYLEKKHTYLLESMEHCLPPTVRRITSHVQQVFECVESSQESPAWEAYLSLVDQLVVQGLKNMVLTAIGTLTLRAQKYEQGAPIPQLVTVDLELQAGDIQFSPPLSSHSPIPTVPETVSRWMDGFTSLTKLVRRYAPGIRDTCYPAITNDPDIRSAISKVTAHLETNARQCQSLRKRFSIYSFLWEQDVRSTFAAFLQGQAPPHPRRFTRPETIRSRASARVESGRPRSSTQSQTVTPAPPETSLFGVMGVSDWDFLCPPGHTPSPEEDISKRPSLDDFDGEIAIFQGILNRLTNIEDLVSVGWLSVNQLPSKQALSSLAAKWKYVYASYLEQRILHVLGFLDQFFNEIEPEVEEITGEEEDTQAFMRLMSVFNRVNAKQQEMDTKFGAVHRAVLIVEKFGHPLSHAAKEQFANVPQRWSNLKKRVALGKQRIAPRIQANGQTISQDLVAFGASFLALRGQFHSSCCLEHGSSNKEFGCLMEGFTSELNILQQQASDLIELQELLEANVFNFSQLKELEEELAALQELRRMAESIQCEHAQWREWVWLEVDCSQLMVGAERQLEAVRSLPQCVKQWNIYVHTLHSIETIQMTIPLVEGLRSSAMRPRHWKQILRYTSAGHTFLLGRGGAFEPASLQEMSFGQLLDLALQCHSDEVLAVVERANKDIAIESLLNTFEEVWLSRQLELTACQRVATFSPQDALPELGLEAEGTSTTPKPRALSARVKSAVRRGASGVGKAVSMASGSPVHQEATTVMLLCNTAGIFETLESHQMSLQSLMGTISAASFSDDLNRWHKQLQTLEAVLGVWLQVQELWLQLKEVYSSTDIQQHLPTATYTFSTVDTEWKELMKATSRNPSVTTVCLREGLLLSLEKLHTSLQECRLTLVHYMESQRLRCPWFYFLSLQDILNFVCYGSNLAQLSLQISKLFPCASRLVHGDTLGELDHRGGSRITGVLSRMGEGLDLTEPVACDGPIDAVLNNLFTSLTTTLRDQLTTVLTRHILKGDSSASRTPSLSSLPAVWSSSFATQVIILSTQIALELCTVGAVAEATSTQNKAPLQDVQKEITNLVSAASQLIRGKSSVSTAAHEAPSPTVSQTDSQVCLDSNTALKASASNVHGVESALSSELLIPDLQKVLQPTGTSGCFLSRDQSNKLQSILLTLSAYRVKIEQLCSQSWSQSLSESFLWQSMLHFNWSIDERTCHLSTLGAKVAYGYHYCGSWTRLVLTPATEKVLVVLLQAVQDNSNPLLLGRPGSGKSSLIEELAVSAGQPLFSLQCSPKTPQSTVTNFIKGMAGTGSWLFLHYLEHLCPSVLQTACNLLSCILQARESRSSSLQWASSTVRVSLDGPCACLASVHPTSVLSHLLLQSFQPCSMQYPPQKQFLEALLLSRGFESSSHLAKSLLAFTDAFNNPINFTGEKELLRKLQTSHLKVVVALAQQHMSEFESLGVLQQQGPLQIPSGVYSEFSGCTRFSVHFKPTFLHPEEGKVGAVQRSSLEEFALVLALKDTVLPSLPPGSSEHSLAVGLLTDTYPNCDVPGLLAHEKAIREALTARSARDSEAAESARESRAASAMQVVAEEQLSEVTSTFEEHIVHCCHLHHLSPTPQFQMAVTQLLTQLHSHSIVAVSGPSCSGKSAAIQVALEATRELIGGATCVTVACNALTEGELMGFYSNSVWQDGLLPKLLAMGGGQTDTEPTKPASKWVILEGQLTSSQVDSLLSLLHPNPHLQLPNGGSVTLTLAHRFILEAPDLSFLSPSSVAQIASLCVAPDTISWRDVAGQWLLRREQGEREGLQSLFDAIVPRCVEFMAPVLEGATCEEMGSGVSVVAASASSELGLRLVRQDLRLTEVNIVNTCCAILECLLSVSTALLSPTDLEMCFVYSVVWACGGFLTAENKAVFDSWWRSIACDMKAQFPDSGLLWDFYVKPGCPTYVPWRESVPHYSPPSDTETAPYVHTVQSTAIQHVVSMLIDRCYPVLLNGAIGSGKTSLLLEALKTHCISGVTDASLLHVTGSGCTGPGVVWDQLLECLQWRWGRRFSPRESKRLICFIDDLHTFQGPEGSSQPNVCEMVRSHLATGGVYVASSGKWHSVSDVCYVGTVCTTPTHRLTPQFLKHFAAIHWNGFDSDALIHIFGTVMQSHFCSAGQSPSAHVINAIVQTAVQLHRKLEKMFIATPKRAHYLFTLRQIAAVFRRLCHCLHSDSGSNELLLLWQSESWWAYAGALGSEVDRERYTEAVTHALRKFFSQSEMLPNLLSDQTPWLLPPHTMAELQSKVSHVMMEYNTANPTLQINLYSPTLTEVHRLSSHFSMAHGLGHTLLFGHTHPEPLVQLAALHAGLTVVQPSFCFSPSLLASSEPQGMSSRSYREVEFQRDLTSVYTRAGIKDEGLVLLVTGSELLHVTFLSVLYEFIKGGDISHLFAPEERSRIISAIRSDLTQSGATFSKSTAWEFFVSRVCRNLRVVMALPAISDVVRCGEWRELVNCMNVYCHQPWDRKQLVAVALHHVQALGLPESQCESLAHLLASIHLELETRQDIPGTSNSKYEYFVERFTHEFQSDSSTSSEHCHTLSSALQSVRTAAEKVELLRSRLERERVVLGEKEEACQSLLVQIGQDTAIFREHNKLVLKQRARINHLQCVIPDYEHACELTVEEKEALIAELRRQVVGMDQESLMVLRALQKPPQEVEELLAAVIMIVKSPTADLSWTKGAKRLLANLDRFCELLLDCSGCEEHSEVILESVVPLLGKPCLNQEQLASLPGETAAVQLCAWVHGVARLHTTLQSKLRPLQLRMFSMKASLREYTEKLKNQEVKLQVLHDRLAGLSRSLEAASVEKSRQNELVNNMARELRETQGFLEVLAGVPEQWERELAISKTLVADTLGGMVVAVALSVYLGAVRPSTQLEVISRALQPVLEERGISLQWSAPSDLLLHLSRRTVNKQSHEDQNHDTEMAKESTSYYDLCIRALPHLVSETLSDQWLSMGYSLPNLLPFAMVTSQWNRWPLIHDLDGTAVSWIKQSRGEELVILDARDRSARFFLCLESALLNGRPVVIESVTTEMDPALQPLVELGQIWDQLPSGSKMVKFCGRKLHVHPSFQLYMTTTCRPEDIPDTLAAQLAIVNFSLSFPLTQDLLVDILFDQVEDYRATCACVAACRSNISQTDRELLELMGGKHCGEGANSAERLEALVKANARCADELSSHLQRLAELSDDRARLLPVAGHGALIYELLQRLGSDSPLLQTSWSQFSEIFMSALSQLHEPLERLKQPTASQSDISALRAVLSALNQALLRATLSSLDHDRWKQLAIAVHLLTYYDPRSDPSTAIDQLCYLSQGDSYLQGLEFSSSPPPPTACVSGELWQSLHRAPLSTAYFREVLQSVHSSPEFWQSLQMEGKLDVSKFPWRESGKSITINDLVFLSCVHKEVALESLGQQVCSLVQPISGASISEVLHTATSAPTVFLYEERSAVSQANLHHLESELRKALEGKTLKVVKFHSGLEETVSELLLQPTSDCILICDIHYTTSEWLERLYWRSTLATSNGCKVMLTASIHSLPISDIFRTSHKVLLSNVVTGLSKDLPRGVWLGGTSSFLPQLQFTLANIPEAMLTECQRLPNSIKHTVFLLTVLHTTLSSTCSSPPHFSNLLAAIRHLTAITRASSDPQVVLASVHSAVTGIYSHCRPGAELDRVTSCCLSHEALSSSASVSPKDGVQVVLPSTGVSPRLYREHVAGLMQDSGTEVTCSHRDLIAGVDNLLVPVIVDLTFLT